MQINLSRANFYLVDDAEYIVAVNAKQASEFYCEQVGEDYEPEADPINPEKKYLNDFEIEVTDEQKLELIKMNEGNNPNSRYFKPLIIGNDQIVMSNNLRFYVRRTLLQELKNLTEGQILFDVPFLIASTEY